MRSDPPAGTPGSSDTADTPDAHEPTGDARRDSPPPPNARTTDLGAPEPIRAHVLSGAAPAPTPPAPPREPEPIVVPPVVDVADLDWDAIRRAVDPVVIRERAPAVLDALEARLDAADASLLLFDADREAPDDRAIAVRTLDADVPLWFVGDLHGDLLALETALALVTREARLGSLRRAFGC